MTGIVIPNNGTIGSASDTDAIAISASGAVTFSKDINPNNFVGMIAPFGMSSVPTGWLACDGSAVSRSTYADLFTAIGTTWGAGDGSSTFAIPDLKGAYLRGVGVSTVFTQDQTITLAQTIDDAFQGHYHNFANYAYYSNENYLEVHTGRGSSPLRTDANAGGVTAPKTDGSNGTPRTANETRPNTRGVQYMIKF
ncbi:Tail Collar domain-containing protein [uncultured Mediterranean phage uvMED]|nr:Tail Collar domain-containing protein [uncultured Mediterranean phage uvMED]